jgi:DNA-binding transcriptional MerR regulator
MTRLTRKALRFYDETGLLKPARVEWDTGYRYYDGSSLQTARQITLFKNCGLSLDEIKRILESGNTEGESFREILIRRRGEMEKISRDIEINRMKLEEMIDEAVGGTSENPEFLPLEGLSGLALSVSGSEEEQIPMALSDLFSWGASAGVSFIPPHRILRNIEGGDPAGDEADYRVFIPTAGISQGDPSRGIVPVTLPAGPGVRIVHRGSFLTVSDSWKSLLSFMETSRVKTDGPVRETYRIPGPLITIEIPVREAL